MKSTWLLLCIFPLLLSAQYESDLEHFFFGRLPSARAEAMGRSYVNAESDLAGIYFNPATSSSINGHQFSSSVASPYYATDESTFLFAAANYQVSRYLKAGLAMNRWQHNNWKELALAKRDFTLSSYSFNLSSEPLKDFHLGVNASYFVLDYGLGTAGEGVSFDFGLTKKFELHNTKQQGHSLQAGASISNFTNLKVEGEVMSNEFNIELPVTARGGISYSYRLSENFLIRKLNTLECLVQTEYQHVLNSDYYTTYKAGAEIKLLEILALRAGYYLQEINDYDISSNHSEASDFTYGFGVEVPLHKLSSFPLRFQLDYTSLPQRPRNDYSPDFRDFHSLSCRLTWMLESS